MALVPMVIEREGNGERAMDLYSRLLKERIVVVQGPIEPVMANIIKSELLFLEGEDPNTDITMYIDSPGGEVATGMGIYDTMQYIKPDIRTICMGTAASMASVLLMGGTRGKRYALPHSEIMIHQPSSGAQGKVSDMERSFRQSIKIKEMLQDLYVDLTKQSRRQIEQDLDRDTWFTAQEAADYGLIDEVLTNH